MVANMTLTETSNSWLPIEPCIKVRYDSNCSGNEEKIWCNVEKGSTKLSLTGMSSFRSGGLILEGRVLSLKLKKAVK